MPGFLRSLAASLAIVMLGACQSLPAAGLVGGASSPAAPDIARHLAYIEKLYNMDTASLDAAFDRVHAAFERKPTLNNRLRLAWIYAAHGHAHTNPWAARKQLMDALAEMDERSEIAALCRIRLAELKRHILLIEENNAAQEKIKAFTHIERDLETRSNSEAPP